MAEATETIAAIASPPGRGGIGIVRISGPQSLAIARQLSRLAPVKRQAHFASFYDAAGRIIDKGILLFFNKPASYTGEDVVELQGHGGRTVMGLLLSRVLELGARPARPGEFTERAFLNGKLDLLQAEAVADLIDSGSARAARSAMNSLQGAFSQTIQALQEKLIDLRVYIEGTLDFPEEEPGLLASGGIQDRIRDCAQTLSRILAQAEKGRVLRQGIRAVILGRPNAGKSSLLNRLTQTERAIVTEVPGTTRDVLEDTLLLDGVTMTLIDTAGIRETGDVIEHEGVQRALRQIAEADVILWVNDITRTGEEPELPEQVQQRTGDQRLVIVNNKIDLAGRGPDVTRTEAMTTVWLSAVSGQGVALLLAELQKFAGDETSGDDLPLARERHIHSLGKALTAIQCAQARIQEAISLELIAEDLRQAQQALGEITGEFTPDDLLGEIFSRFCIGK